MTDLDTHRKNIQNWIEDYQTSDSYDIGSARIDWLSGRQQWQLTLPNGEIHREDNGCGNLISFIDDADIQDYYPSIVEYFEDEECDPADFPGMTAEELKLYKAAQ